jgi:hypothetical protein
MASIWGVQPRVEACVDQPRRFGTATHCALYPVPATLGRQTRAASPQGKAAMNPAHCKACNPPSPGRKQFRFDSPHILPPKGFMIFTRTAHQCR